MQAPAEHVPPTKHGFPSKGAPSQGVPSGSFKSGHTGDVPSQKSSASHGPPDIVWTEVHCVPAGFTVQWSVQQLGLATGELASSHSSPGSTVPLPHAVRLPVTVIDTAAQVWGSGSGGRTPTVKVPPKIVLDASTWPLSVGMKPAHGDPCGVPVSEKTPVLTSMLPEKPSSVVSIDPVWVNVLSTFCSPVRKT
jgi:hypothetical protein